VRSPATTKSFQRKEYHIRKKPGFFLKKHCRILGNG
jgi:hypothetical protein